MTVLRLTTRSIRTAQAIRDREDFRTSGALYGEEIGRMHRWQSGLLSGDDLDQFYLDMGHIDYVVMSYSTPIAWHWTAEDGSTGWHKVAQKFSSTTSKHQGNLYLIGREVLTNDEQSRMCIPATIGGVPAR
jgi:hypothetical protein